ncbi:hypothetical protein K6969_00535 [Streptococcus suis]|uniref:Lin0368 family putative glycerol transporter subunit n=1 Tax=Streptococcus suis TaxID=1307 RepID=UPI0004091E7D|nr:hypothetical protein [Streptococcus suis]QZT29458.1 hypothetical protein K6969_00535 [Streptococcus suis]HEM3165773.1 hypothetical protein [Streptococcus suis 92-1191]HEM6182900.1 hypothetical protein [Streptococcus suis]
MTLIQMLSTFLGGFLLPLIILLFWGRSVARFRVFGGFLSATLIVGTLWYLNHGSAKPLIVQTSSVVVDMGLATGIGVLVYGLARGKDWTKTRPLLLSAILGGVLAGVLLTVV